MTIQPSHFVKYRLKDDSLSEHYVTFSSRAPKTPVTKENHPLISQLAETDSATAEKVERLIREMTANEQRFFSWLGGDASRMESFMKNPISALRQAIPELSEAFFDELGSLPKPFASRN